MGKLQVEGKAEREADGDPEGNPDRSLDFLNEFGYCPESSGALLEVVVCFLIINS